MSLLNVIPRHEGSVGDVRKVKGFSYVKAKNGKWGVVFDKKLFAYLTKLHADGATHVEISNTTGIPRPKVTKTLNELGLSRKPERRIKVQKTLVEQSLVDDDKICKKVYRFYVQHELSAKDTAIKLSLSTTTVKRILRSNGWHRQVEGGTRTSRSVKKYAKAITLRTIERQLSRVCDSYTDYCDAARKLTNAVVHLMRASGYSFAKRTKSNHLDHKYSIHSAFNKNLPLAWLCHPANLEYLSANDNIVKGDSNSITLKDLYFDILDWNSCNLNPFKDYDYKNSKSVQRRKH